MKNNQHNIKLIGPEAYSHKAISKAWIIGKTGVAKTFMTNVKDECDMLGINYNFLPNSYLLYQDRYVEPYISTVLLIAKQMNTNPYRLLIEPQDVIEELLAEEDGVTHNISMLQHSFASSILKCTLEEKQVIMSVMAMLLGYPNEGREERKSRLTTPENINAYKIKGRRAVLVQDEMNSFWDRMEMVSNEAEKKGHSISNTARIAGISPSSLYLARSNRKDTLIKSILAYATVTDTDICWLLSGKTTDEMMVDSDFLTSIKNASVKNLMLFFSQLETDTQVAIASIAGKIIENRLSREAQESSREDKTSDTGK